MRGVRFALGLGMLAVAVGLAGRAGAQEIEIGVTPEARPPKPPEIVTPPGSREITRPRESGFYPQDIRVRLDPAFIEPFGAIRQVGPKSAVQFGLAGWTAPNTLGRQHEGDVREIHGWFALGFAIIWDLPPERAQPAASGPAK
jgi:hypothetical protein